MATRKKKAATKKTKKTKKTMTRLQQLATGGIKAESDKDWFSSYNPSETSSDLDAAEKIAETVYSLRPELRPKKEEEPKAATKKTKNPERVTGSSGASEDKQVENTTVHLKDKQPHVQSDPEASAKWRDKKALPQAFMPLKDDNSIEFKLLERMKQRGLLVEPTLGQLRAVKTWTNAAALEDFLKHAPAGMTTDELLKDLRNKFGIVCDPPKGRFYSFARDEMFINKQEADRLDQMGSNIKHKLPKMLEESGGMSTTSRLEPPTSESLCEKLEAQYADKIKAYLKAKRELENARLELEREYNYDSQARDKTVKITLPNEGESKAQSPEETPIFNLTETLDQMFNRRY